MIVGEYEYTYDLAPRSFLFAFNTSYADISGVEAKLKEFTAQNQAHVHGLAVMEKDWFIAQKAYKVPHEFLCNEGKSLAMFYSTLLVCVQSIKVGTASMKHYLKLHE